MGDSYMYNYMYSLDFVMKTMLGKVWYL